MDEEPSEEGIYRWDDISEFPDHLKKYWHQRFKIWQNYSKGVWMTEDAWFEVTPEPIANKIATHVAEATPKEITIVIDAFAGVGGNAIAFARSNRWTQVFAVEKDAKAMQCARHNAKLYGVDKKIVFVTGDCFDVIKRRFGEQSHVVIFASPPWGGTQYSNEDVFDLATMQPYNLDKLYKSFSRWSKHVILYLPRNSDLNQLALHGSDGRKLEVAHYCMLGASKALCAYYGDFDFEGEDEDAAGSDIEQETE